MVGSVKQPSKHTSDLRKMVSSQVGRTQKIKQLETELAAVEGLLKKGIYHTRKVILKHEQEMDRWKQLSTLKDGKHSFDQGATDKAFSYYVKPDTTADGYISRTIPQYSSTKITKERELEQHIENHYPKRDDGSAERQGNSELAVESFISDSILVESEATSSSLNESHLSSGSSKSTIFTVREQELKVKSILSEIHKHLST